MDYMVSVMISLVLLPLVVAIPVSVRALIQSSVRLRGGDKYDMWCNDDCESGGGVGCGGIGINTLNPQCYTDSVKKEDCQRLLQ